MKWDAVQKRGLKENCLVYAMDQSQTAPITEPGPWGRPQEGYCAGLAARWIALHYVGSDYSYDAKTKECENPDWQATRDYAIRDDSKKGFPDAYKKVFDQYGLTLNKGSHKKFQSFPCLQLVQAVGDFRGCCLLGMWGNGGHVVALGRAPQYKSEWFFFDPNFGEFKFPGANETVKFLQWFFADSGYAKSFKTSGIVGVNAPPFVQGDLAQMTKQGWSFG